MGLYSDLHRLQEGRCGICAEPMASPVEDHDHTTGFVRGLRLCSWHHTLGGRESVHGNPALAFELGLLKRKNTEEDV